MKTGLDFSAIRAELDGSPWEPRDDGEGAERRVYLGTVFALTPSGKFYTPFACSNVAGCPQCGGSGSFPTHRKQRIIKKWHARNERRSRRIQRMRAAGVPEETVRAYYTRTHHIDLTTECAYCGGCGSREAHLDELWREAAEAGMEAIGAALENGEGDPCDLFAVEYRDEPPESDEDEDAPDSEQDEMRALPWRRPE